MNSSVKLNLIVIRASDIDRAAAFYRKLGLAFVKHRHGNGVEHFASELAGVTFEIYPHTDRSMPTTSTRLGFEIYDLEEIICELENSGTQIVSHPQRSEWGLRAVVTDPDGNRVELTQIETF